MSDSGTNVSISTKLLATGLALAVTLVVCATAATVTLSSELSRKAERDASPPDLTALERHTFRNRGATEALIDSLVASLGPLPDADGATVARITALVADDTMPMRVWDASASDMLSRGQLRLAEPMLSLTYALDSMQAEQVVRAEADTGSDQALLFRSWARTRPMPALWGYRPEFPGVRDISELAPRDVARLRALFAMNDNAALLELRSGDYASAAERARESLSASRHLIEEPRMPDALMGVRFARRAAQIMAVAAQRTGDREIFEQASRLDAQASQADVSILKWVVQQEANPESKAALSVSSNERLMPGLRVEVMHSIAMGGCRNIREVVFGFSDMRRIALDSVAQSIRDLPRASEIASLYLRQFEAISTNARFQADQLRASGSDRLRSTGALDWIVPPSVRARIELCRVWGI